MYQTPVLDSTTMQDHKPLRIAYLCCSKAQNFSQPVLRPKHLN